MGGWCGQRRQSATLHFNSSVQVLFEVCRKSEQTEEVSLLPQTNLCFLFPTPMALHGVLYTQYGSEPFQEFTWPGVVCVQSAEAIDRARQISGAPLGFESLYVCEVVRTLCP